MSDKWSWKSRTVYSFLGEEVQEYFVKEKKEIDLQDTEDYLNKLEELLEEAHDVMDKCNVELDEDFHCHFCRGEGYDANGLIHLDSCILIKIRKEIDV